mmetsp:Transcript_19383/g.37317  ORF Transcript_19383/g.37317 Transcript_19383/m.37317 type:complete len:221 (+) Transcript_19383:82-744(+)
MQLPLFGRVAGNGSYESEQQQKWQPRAAAKMFTPSLIEHLSKKPHSMIYCIHKITRCQKLGFLFPTRRSLLLLLPSVSLPSARCTTPSPEQPHRKEEGPARSWTQPVANQTCCSNRTCAPIHSPLLPCRPQTRGPSPNRRAQREPGKSPSQHLHRARAVVTFCSCADRMKGSTPQQRSARILRMLIEHLRTARRASRLVTSILMTAPCSRPQTSPTTFGG